MYSLVSEHLGDFLAHAEESYAAPLPRYVVRELRGFLDCGQLDKGTTVTY